MNRTQSRSRAMEALIKHVDDMNWSQRFADAKVPENGGILLIPLKIADPESLKQDIVKHKEFYEQLEAALLRVRDCEEDATELLEELDEKQKQLYEEDKIQIGNDISKILYNLHREFVDENPAFQTSMKRLYAVSYRRELKRSEKMRETNKEMLKATMAVYMSGLERLKDNNNLVRRRVRMEAEAAHGSYKMCLEEIEELNELEQQLIENLKRGIEEMEKQL